MAPKISACVITFNEERNIRRCLESVKWCDEIVVVDSFSTDRTVELCKEYTPRVYQNEWLGYIGQKNFIRKMATHPWILFVDADEEVSPELRAEIIAELEKNGEKYCGYQFPRMVNYLGKWIRHGEWYPDMKLRLFLRLKGQSCGQEPHDQIVVQGPVRTLKSPLHHYTYEGIHDHVETMNRFSSITAQEKFRAGDSFYWRDFLFRPGLRFLKAYVVRRGFLDGKRGFLIALVAAFGVCMKYAKLWELRLNARKKSG
jgi:glycosyltransferase involved in cell wall biosynthesis